MHLAIYVNLCQIPHALSQHINCWLTWTNNTKIKCYLLVNYSKIKQIPSKFILNPPKVADLRYMGGGQILNTKLISNP